MAHCTEDVVTVRIPTYVGSMGRRLEPPNCTVEAYEWVVYVKSFYDEDLSQLIRRVEFDFHPIFGRPKYVVSKPPYILKDIAFGQFDIGVTIYFKHIRHKTMQVFHTVNLFGAPFLSQLEKMQDDKWLHANQLIPFVYQNPRGALRRLLDKFSQIDDEVYAKMEKNQQEQRQITAEIRQLKEEMVRKYQRKRGGRKPEHHYD